MYKNEELNIRRLGVEEHMNRNTISLETIIPVKETKQSQKANCVSVHVLFDIESCDI